jgi:hypothetical protein
MKPEALRKYNISPQKMPTANESSIMKRKSIKRANARIQKPALVDFSTPAVGGGACNSVPQPEQFIASSGFLPPQ